LIHSSRAGVPSESSVSRANCGMKIGPSSLGSSPLPKNRPCSEPPLAFIPYPSWCPRWIGHVVGFINTLNDVRLSSVQPFWLSLTSVQRVSLPVASWPHEAYVVG